MKRMLAVLLLTALLVTSGRLALNAMKQFAFGVQVTQATGAIFSGDKRDFHCSGTEIGHTSDGGGIFLTARHCVADPRTNKLTQDMVVSFTDNQGGPYYDAEPIAISMTDDLALLYLRNGAQVPEVKVRDNRGLINGSPIFNVSFPLGMGKQKFHGEYMRDSFPALPVDLLQRYPFWLHAMPMNMTIAHGSSGSGVFSEDKLGLVGVVVATFQEGSFTGSIPGNRVLYFLNDLKDNTVAKFVEQNPQKPDLSEFF